jgi:hypothetical protein
MPRNKNGEIYLTQGRGLLVWFCILLWWACSATIACLLSFWNDTVAVIFFVLTFGLFGIIPAYFFRKEELKYPLEEEEEEESKHDTELPQEDAWTLSRTGSDWFIKDIIDRIEKDAKPVGIYVAWAHYYVITSSEVAIGLLNRMPPHKELRVGVTAGTLYIG